MSQVDVGHETGHDVVFVVGPPRSGTTWLQTMLSEHPDVVTTKESHLFSAYLGPWDRRYQFEKSREFPDIGLFALFSESEMDGFHGRIVDWVFGRIRSKSPSANLLLEKTPNHALDFELILRVLPDAKFILVMRDPRAVVASMIAASRSWGRGWAPKGSHDGALLWSKYADAVDEIRDRCDNALLVRFEDIRKQGGQELLRLFNFMGLDATLDDCENYQHRHNIDRERAENKTIPKGFVRSGSLESWRNELSASEVATIEYLTAPSMERFGYERTTAREMRTPLRVLLRRLVSKMETAAKVLHDRL